MNYENSSAMQPPQNDHKLLQNLSQIPAPAYGVAVVLGMCSFGAIPVWAGGLMLVSGYAIWNAAENARKLKEEKARAATFANIIGPYVMSSLSPAETAEDLAQRAAEFRAKLALSGNPYAHLIEVVEYPYTPLLVDYGQLQGGWSIYCRMVGEEQHKRNLEWYAGKCPAPLKTLFASAVLPAPKQPTIEL